MTFHMSGVNKNIKGPYCIISQPKMIFVVDLSYHLAHPDEVNNGGI